MTTAHNILIVDDEAHILQVLSLKLRNCGYSIATAVDGEDALHQAKTDPPDLVITDVQMPYMNGLEFAHALSTNKETAHIPVVVLTARGHTLEACDTNIPNVRKVLSKPFSPRGVAELCAQLLKDVPVRNTGKRDVA
ncbi:MAG: response regulator [Phycisphaerae bacterium]|jgi:two-component system, OmpR family, alkaline phosphatase synthesis response regulator PhoP|nr:response regulator [Phycisphaerae bacterium]MBT5365177.1 response regulator [Phycisphaerae bacterium]MBT6268979.1 response regulator [Phycisphaerae bacterium]MBT6282925.1 response regulator [Phycisphaerae bacterium]